MARSFNAGHAHCPKLEKKKKQKKTFLLQVMNMEEFNFFENNSQYYF